MRLFNFFIFFIIGLLSLNFACAETIKQNTDNVEIELFSDNKSEIIALISIKEGWHIYYKNPGEIGKPTFVENIGKNEVTVINQSVPIVTKAYDIMDEYLYENRAYFQLKAKNNKPLNFAFNFTECADVCKPEKLVFNLKELPLTEADEWLKIQHKAEKTFPLILNSDYLASKKAISLKLPYHKNIKVIPEERETISGEEFLITSEGDKTQISWQNIDERHKLNHALILIPEKAFEVNINYDVFDWQYFIYIVILAFFGGMILNAMPCVFPILSLKIFSLVKNYDGQRHYKNAFLYTLGVLVSFVALAAILDILKEGGEAIGWGFQLQSPLFVALMMLLFFVLFLYMIEALPFPEFANSWLHKMSGANMFLTGFFAVLIASPCTGPFMGAAIGYAFMQTDIQMYAVFVALALGYALPFALAEIYPHALQQVLPKPGAWMAKLKALFAIPILLTCIWLSSVLVAQVYNKEGINKNNLDWRTYSSQEVTSAVLSGNKVFIDFTADWCLTCMFNEKTKLNSKKFADFVRKNEVILFKADLTESNEEYNDALSAYGRDGIPVYIYYENENYQILPIFFDVEDLSH